MLAARSPPGPLRLVRLRLIRFGSSASACLLAHLLAPHPLRLIRFGSSACGLRLVRSARSFLRLVRLLARFGSYALALRFGSSASARPARLLRLVCLGSSAMARLLRLVRFDCFGTSAYFVIFLSLLSHYHDDCFCIERHLVARTVLTLTH